MASVFRFEAVERARRTAPPVAATPVAPEPEPEYVPQRPLPAFAVPSTGPRPTMPPAMVLPSTVQIPTADVRHASSVAPVEIEIDVDVDLAPPPRRQSVADSTMQIILDLTRVSRRIPQRRLGWIVATAVGVSLLILVAGVTRRALSSDDDTRATLAAMVAPQKPAPTTRGPLSTAAPSSTGPARLAPSPVGTVVGPAGRVYIDGKQVHGTSAIVPCGNHSVRVAPTNKAKLVDVPCGGELRIK